VIAFTPQNLFVMILTKNTCQKGNMFDVFFFAGLHPALKIVNPFGVM